MKCACLCIALFFCFHAKAQDTVFYKNAGKLVVVLKEISQTEIKYQKFDMQDGPMYIVSKNDIDKIIYKNGYTEVMTPVVVNTQPQIMYQSGTLYKEKITYRDTKIRYRSLVDLAHGNYDIKRQPELSQMALSLKRYKATQDGTRTGAVVCGALAIAGTALYGLATLFDSSTGDDALFIAPPAALGVLAIAFTSLSITFNIKLKQKRNAFVNLYNE